MRRFLTAGNTDSLPTTAAQRWAELTKQLEHHNTRYYVLDQPEITDYDYDTRYP